MPSNAPAPTRVPNSVLGRNRWRQVGAIAVVLAVLLAIVWMTTRSNDTSTAGTQTVATTHPLVVTTISNDDDVDTVSTEDLPREAQQVLATIRRGGPYRYRQDGVTFENRERLLPPHPKGWYREFTVTTPGSADRGPRRLILGRDGRVWYTADHYRSFVLLTTRVTEGK